MSGKEARKMRGPRTTGATPASNTRGRNIMKVSMLTEGQATRTVGRLVRECSRFEEVAAGLGDEPPLADAPHQVPRPPDPL